MALRGLGTDIIEIARIERVIAHYGDRFLDRIFTEKEQQYCFRFRKSALHFAGRFAAKEAVVKALGTGIREGIGWVDIEILNDSMGKPSVFLSFKARDHFPSAEFLISISHSKNMQQPLQFGCEINP